MAEALSCIWLDCALEGWDIQLYLSTKIAAVLAGKNIVHSKVEHKSGGIDLNKYLCLDTLKLRMLGWEINLDL